MEKRKKQQSGIRISLVNGMNGRIMEQEPTNAELRAYHAIAEVFRLKRAAHRALRAGDKLTADVLTERQAPFRWIWFGATPSTFLGLAGLVPEALRNLRRRHPADPLCVPLNDFERDLHRCRNDPLLLETVRRVAVAIEARGNPDPEVQRILNTLARALCADVDLWAILRPESERTLYGDRPQRLKLPYEYECLRPAPAQLGRFRRQSLRERPDQAPRPRG